MTKQNSDNIRKLIKESRPNLSDSSINTYLSSLYHLYKKTGDTTDFSSLKFLFDFDEITKILKDMNFKQSKLDECLFKMKQGKDIIYILTHVDDLMVIERTNRPE